MKEVKIPPLLTTSQREQARLIRRLQAQNRALRAENDKLRARALTAELITMTKGRLFSVR